MPLVQSEMTVGRDWCWKVKSSSRQRIYSGACSEDVSSAAWSCARLSSPQFFSLPINLMWGRHVNTLMNKTKPCTWAQRGFELNANFRMLTRSIVVFMRMLGIFFGQTVFRELMSSLPLHGSSAAWLYYCCVLLFLLFWLLRYIRTM